MKAANNAGISCNSSSPLRKKQRNNNVDNNDNSVSYYQKNCFRCQQLSVLIIFQQSLTQEAANITGEVENEEAN